MELFTSKWMIAGIILISIILILFLIGRKSVHSEIIIPATPAEVWAVLTDFDKAKEWNTVLIPKEGTLKEGETVKYEFRQDEENISEIPAKVIQIKEAALLNQGGGMTGILTFDHRYILEEAAEGTKLTIHEEYRGLFVPFWNPAPVEQAYHRLAEALKNRVIQVNQSPSE